jgi:rhodanese-related sulfurtransferase
MGHGGPAPGPFRRALQFRFLNAVIPQIRPAQLAVWLQSSAQHGTAVVLDVREPVELQIAPVKSDGFTLIAIPMGEIPSRLAELDAGQPIACLCHHGVRSHRVAAFLQAQGFEHVVNISGGVAAWSDELDASIARY